MRAALAAAAVTAGMLGLTGTAAAHQDCEATACVNVEPRVDPTVGPVVDQVGPVVEQFGPNELDLGDFLGGLFG